jgi:hypothetical protein
MPAGMGKSRVLLGLSYIAIEYAKVDKIVLMFSNDAMLNRERTMYETLMSGFIKKLEMTTPSKFIVSTAYIKTLILMDEADYIILDLLWPIPKTG